MGTKRSIRLGLFRFTALVVFAAGTAISPAADAQTADELRAARELFQEAFKDEQEKRYDEALEKFRRVAKVRESASVRYRIATVLAASGHLREARDVFRALAASKASLPANDREIADSSAERVAELDRRIPRLSLRIQDSPPPDVRVTVDGAPVPVSTTARSLELDPGDHVILATAQGSKPSEEHVVLAESEPEAVHIVSLVPDASAAPARDPLAPATGQRYIIPWVAIGAGAVLVAVGGGLLLARDGAISDIKDSCPAGRCPTRLKSDVDSDRSRAELFGPLGVGLAVVGIAAVGFGVYLLTRHPKDAARPYVIAF
jgi:hypothetical protein